MYMYCTIMGLVSRVLLYVENSKPNMLKHMVAKVIDKLKFVLYLRFFWNLTLSTLTQWKLTLWKLTQWKLTLWTLTLWTLTRWKLTL